MAVEEANLMLAPSVWRPARGAVTELALSGERVALTASELDLLLNTLAGLELRPAASVADDIAALRLAGGCIFLAPTAAELDALRFALAALATAGETTAPSLVRLRALCDPPQLATQ